MKEEVAVDELEALEGEAFKELFGMTKESCAYCTLTQHTRAHSTLVVDRPSLTGCS